MYIKCKNANARMLVERPPTCRQTAHHNIIRAIIL